MSPQVFAGRRDVLAGFAITLAAMLAPASQARQSAPARLVTHGKERKLELPPEGSGKSADPNPVLIRLLARAHAAQRLLVDGRDEPSVSHYSKRDLWQLLRISWLAPDIVSDIIEGRQPAGLTGRRLLRCSDLPFEWTEQRAFLGFS